MRNRALFLSAMAGIMLLGACNKQERIPVTMSTYESNYAPHLSKKMPVINITSSSGNNDFVTKPVAENVSEAKKEWNGYHGEPAPWYEACSITVNNGDEKEMMKDVSAQVKVRGNWTTDYPKKPLRIKFDKKQSMLDMHEREKYKNWVLLASYKDWSMLRDPVALYLYKMMTGNYSSDFEPVEVYVNNEYFGVYLLAEQQEIKSGRISISEPKEDENGTLSTLPDIGYFLEFDGYYASEDYGFTIDYIDDLMDINNKKIDITKLNSGYTIKNSDCSSEQKTFITRYMNNLWNLCYQAVYKNKYYQFKDDDSGLIEANDIKNTYECVSPYIDIESLVTTYIQQEVVCDPDLYWSSFLMDLDFNKESKKKLTFEAPWDFDSSMGNKKHAADGKGFFAGAKQFEVNYEKDGYANPWMLIFVKETWFQDLVKQKWKEMKEKKVFDKVYSYMDSISTSYQSDFEANYRKWNNIGKNETVGDELNDKASSCKTEKEACDYLASWLKTRVSFLDSKWH